MAGDEKLVVLTAVGSDRPGLVRQLSELVRSAGGSLRDSRMAILGGEFAVIMLIAGSEAALEAISKERGTLEERLGLTVSLKETREQKAPRDFLPYKIRISGVDRPGIVSTIAAILAGREINVASLDSRVHYAPLSGTPLFLLHADLQVPSELALSELREELSKACEEENLDLTLEAR